MTGLRTESGTGRRTAKARAPRSSRTDRPTAGGKPRAAKARPAKARSAKPRPAKPRPAGSKSRPGTPRQAKKARSAGAPKAPLTRTDRRLRALVAVLVLAAAWPVWKLVVVLFADGDDLAARGAAQSVSTATIPATRGAILDRNGMELAISLPRVKMAVNLAHLADLEHDEPGSTERFLEIVAEASGVSATRLRDLVEEAEERDPWLPLIEEVTPEVADRAEEELLAAGLLEALVVEDTSIRVHPAGDSALRLVGTVGPEGPGPSAGVERSLDELLAGRPGERRAEQGSDGTEIPGTARVGRAPVPGADVWLTIDRSIQYEVERMLVRGAQAASAGGGVAIVGRPGTGELLAVASVDRDPTTGEVRLSDDPKAFADAHQAGSVFKLVPIAAAMEDGVIDVDRVYSVPDSIQVYDRVFRDHDPHPVQAMSVRQILAQSSNVGTIRIAQELGAERLHEALVDFGFGSRTGVANPAESAGVLPPIERWQGPDLAASAIGTHQAATAVQLWAAYNVIANDGRYVAPRLIDRVERPDGTSPSPEPGGSRQVISPAAAAQVEEALLAVVSEGTGKRWDLPGFPVAAKTGTGRMPSPGKAVGGDGYLWPDGRYHYLNAFTGYLPADDPQVSITVLLEDVAPGLTGSSGAGPVFSELSRLAIRELGIAPSPTDTATAGVAEHGAGGASTLPPTTAPAPMRAEPARRATTTTTPKAAAPGSTTTTSAPGTPAATTRSTAPVAPDDG